MKQYFFPFWYRSIPRLCVVNDSFRLCFPTTTRHVETSVQARLHFQLTLQNSLKRMPMISALLLPPLVTIKQLWTLLMDFSHGLRLEKLNHLNVFRLLSVNLIRGLIQVNTFLILRRFILPLTHCCVFLMNLLGLFLIQGKRVTTCQETTSSS